MITFGHACPKLFYFLNLSITRFTYLSETSIFKYASYSFPVLDVKPFANIDFPDNNVLAFAFVILISSLPKILVFFHKVKLQFFSL